MNEQKQIDLKTWKEIEIPRNNTYVTTQKHHSIYNSHACYYSIAVINRLDFLR